ncbi:MAG: hypothetical protein NTX50_05150 [Candidatus Sumerlaeota bacterium]|nr:hypothetical protein [Candidatus Sumerlaeota bacterium]
MADMTNEELIQLVKKKISEKDEVIHDQMRQIQELESQILDLQERLNAAEKGGAARSELVSGITQILEQE